MNLVAEDLLMVRQDVGGGMNFQLQIEQMSGYLAAKFTGVGAPGEAGQLIESIAEHCKRTNNDKLIIDSTGFEVKLSTADRFLLGERLGIFARHKIKVAFVSKPEQIEPRKFAVMVARNRGVIVEVFTDLQAAEEWLFQK
jgi:hypothetical protein